MVNPDWQRVLVEAAADARRAEALLHPDPAPGPEPGPVPTDPELLRGHILSLRARLDRLREQLRRAMVVRRSESIAATPAAHYFDRRL